ncbi:unnamed protein product [Periconia digitata]|uniref:Uncharacterized protein n=1 Tax=Periconia digitata TaxID=1303443 RepID=A0A9W4XWR8_9PLEO|nr:unnamed protein product [Periconia digitata]
MTLDPIFLLIWFKFEALVKHARNAPLQNAPAAAAPSLKTPSPSFPTSSLLPPLFPYSSPIRPTCDHAACISNLLHHHYHHHHASNTTRNNSTMLTPELEILKPIDPSITNSDDYEIYVLSNAHVVYERNGKPANLLRAYGDVPLKVEGRLDSLDRKQAKNLVKKPFRPVDVVIRNVTRFSYGQMTDGELVIWALGAAGWFEIRPRRDYKPIFQDMVDAVELLYFVSDIYNEPRKRGGGPSAQLVFQEYAEDERYPCTDPEVAASLFSKHHEFLIMSFLERAQGLAWGNTPICQYFKKLYPKIYETTKARVEGRSEKSVKAAVKPSPAPSTSSATRRNARLKKDVEAHPKKDDNWWEAAAIYEFIRSAVNKLVLKPGCNHITLDRVSKLMVKRYEIEEAEIAKSICLVHADNLCYKMRHPRSKSASFLADEPIYHELQTGHELSAIDVRRAEAVALRPRKDHNLYLVVTDDEEDEEDEDEDSDDALVTPRRKPDRRKKKGRLSVLRPTASKYSGKGKGVKRFKGKSKGPPGEVPPSEESQSGADAEDDSSDNESRMGADTPTQALSPGRSKRKFVSTLEDDEQEKGRRKRAASNSITPKSPPTTTSTIHSSEQEDSPTTSNSEEDTEEDEDADADDETALPLRYRPTSTNPNDPDHRPNNSVIPPIVSTPLPTYEANGPRDSWNCTFDGCSQRIYGASKEMGRRLITEHLEDHAKGRETVVGILLREEEKLRLPVNNLLKKIRELSEAQTPLFPPSASSSTSPSPDPDVVAATSKYPPPLPQPIRRVV